MRILIAPDSFKGSLPAAAVASALAAGIAEELPDAELIELPLADGGDGTLDAFARAFPSAERHAVRVHGANGELHDAYWLSVPGQSGTLGVVELASTCGIERLGRELLPWDADSRGFGEAIADALRWGVAELLLAVGSSASTDGGMGLLAALGMQFHDASGAAVACGARGMMRVSRIDKAGLLGLPRGGARVLCDVAVPLTGPGGAVHMFGPQKGFARSELAAVDRGLQRFGLLLREASGRGVPLETPGAGAAGGVGYALLSWGAQFASGASAVAALLGLDKAIAAADFVIAGEGRFDESSLHGKAPGVVAAAARAADVPFALVAGSIAAKAAPSWVHSALELSVLAGSTERAMAAPMDYLVMAGRRLGTELRDGAR